MIYEIKPVERVILSADEDGVTVILHYDDSEDYGETFETLADALEWIAGKIGIAEDD